MLNLRPASVTTSYEALRARSTPRLTHGLAVPQAAAGAPFRRISKTSSQLKLPSGGDRV